jgi:hypothetical protein
MIPLGRSSLIGGPEILAKGRNFWPTPEFPALGAEIPAWLEEYEIEAKISGKSRLAPI